MLCSLARNSRLYIVLQTQLAGLATLALYALIFSFAAESVSAQGQTPAKKGWPSNVPKKFTPEMLEIMGKKLGIDANGIEMRRLLYKEPIKQTWNEQLGIVKHLKGKAGISFPSIEQTQPPLKATVDRQLLEQEYTQHVNAVKQHLAEPITFPRCNQNRTAKTELSPGARAQKGDSNDVIFDMLFISKKDVLMATDFQEALGTKTMVLKIDDEHPDAIAMTARAYGVPCLPSRFRVTSRFRFQDEGLNAVFNFGDKGVSRGKLPQSLDYMRSRYP